MPVNLICYFYNNKTNLLEEFRSHKNELDKELESFMVLLNQILPFYHSLLNKKELDSDELKRLGEIEHYLLSVNTNIMEIRKRFI